MGRRFAERETEGIGSDGVRWHPVASIVHIWRDSREARVSQAAIRENTKSQPGPWEKEFDDLARALSGAFLFGTPLLFTMEMWWIGTYSELWRLLIFLALALAVNVMLSFLVGFEESNNKSRAISQAIKAVAVGAVASTLTLLVLGRISWGDPLDSILGKIVLQTIPLSIGASVANALLNRGDGGSEQSGESEGGGSGEKQSPGTATLRAMGAAVGGSVLIGFSVAPTEEIPMLATEMQVWNEIALIVFSLAITYLIVFVSGFSPQSGDRDGPFQSPFSETVLSYVVALAVSFAALYLFGQLELGGEPLTDIVSKVLVLGTPAAIGGAAGRALIGGMSSGK
jgi:putative integral membrane protein (TIGR02587 family)